MYVVWRSRDVSVSVQFGVGNGSELNLLVGPRVPCGCDCLSVCLERGTQNGCLLLASLFWRYIFSSLKPRRMGTFMWIVERCRGGMRVASYRSLECSQTLHTFLFPWLDGCFKCGNGIFQFPVVYFKYSQSDRFVALIDRDLYRME
jgi:hypothetical protein